MKYQLILLSLVALAASVPVSKVKHECPLCRMYCPNGYVNEDDANGCPKCQCACPLTGCPKMDCMNGQKKDAYGCEMCDCEGCIFSADCYTANMMGRRLEGCNGNVCEAGSNRYAGYKKDAAVEDEIDDTELAASFEQKQKAEANRMAWYKANLPINQYDEITESWEK